MTKVTKSILVEKMDEAGHGLARLADLSAVDHDDDTYSPGAFSWKQGGEQWVPILPAHNRTAMPLGKARVYEQDGVAYAELHLNLETEAGREWHKHLKFDLQTGSPSQEWSYGFGVVDAAFEDRAGNRVRILKRVDVHEVSPVVRGAGVGTATLTMKSHGSFGDQIDAAIDIITDLVERGEDIADLRKSDGRPMSAKRIEQLESLKRRIEDLIGTKSNVPTRCSKCGGEDLDEKGQCKNCKADDEGVVLATNLAAKHLTRDARLRHAGR